jgi:YVTN family beta-propeller protein
VTYSTGDAVGLVSTATRKVTAEIPVGHQPRGIAVSPDGKRAYVAHFGAHTVGVVDLKARKMIAEIPVGWCPEGVVLEANGSRLWVANWLGASVSVIDTAEGRETGRIGVPQRPVRLALSPEGRTLLVTCDSGIDESRGVVMIDTETDQMVRGRLDSAANLKGVAVSPDGNYALAVHQRAKIRLPATDIDGGNVFTNAVSYVPLKAAEVAPPPAKPGEAPVSSGTSDGKPKGLDLGSGYDFVDDPRRAGLPVILDTPGRFWADPHDVVFSPDGKRAFVTSGGGHALLVLDTAKLIHTLADPKRTVAVATFPNGQGVNLPIPPGQGSPTVPSRYETWGVTLPPPYLGTDRLEGDAITVSRVEMPFGPRNAALSPDGRTLWACCPLDDSLGVVELAGLRAVRVAVGDAQMNDVRLGERAFSDAKFCKSGAFTCASCHPGGGEDGLVWNLAAERKNGQFLSTKGLLGCAETGRMGWHGEQGTLLERLESTYRLTMKARISTSEIRTVVEYLSSTSAPKYPTTLRMPMIARGVTEARTVPPIDKDGRLSEAAARGKRIFAGKGRCSTCHAGPALTVGELRDVGTGGPFKVPSLRGVWSTAPYLHTGGAERLQDIFTPTHNPQRQHGRGADLADTELADLVEYLKTL